MLRLTTRFKIGLYISAFAVIVLLSTVMVFTLAYVSSITRQLKNDLIKEADEIATRHMEIQDGRLIFVNDQDGNSIQSDLTTDQASAVIYNRDLEIIGKFGVFDYANDASFDITSKSKIDETIKSGNYAFDENLKFNGAYTYMFLFYPIKSDKNDIIGAIQIAVKTDQTDYLVNTLKSLLLIIVPLSVFISLLAGQLLASIAYKPLEKLLAKMQTVSAANLNKPITPEGSSKDEVYRLTEAYNRMTQRLHESFEKQKEFVSNASHELKSPVARALSTLEVSEINLADKEYFEVKKRISLAKDDLKELSSTVNALLLLSRIEENTEFKAVEINVYDFISRKCDVIAKQYHDLNINVEVNIPSTQTIGYSIEHFGIIVDNLLSNAYKYNIKEGKILIRTRTIDRQLSLEVENTGVVIEKSDKSKVFERFYRARSNKSIAGVGLGLTIVKSICDATGLTIHVDSTDSKNTIFRIAGFIVID